ncbi:lipopolysaccharide biosynthesis protein [Psychroserpens mesophilus]|uniref:lipopolysaccharide biosynthesis protein n=1 Tax=Psychroserpens mesophilus TaxID=325473 RepID=UPI003D6622D7
MSLKQKALSGVFWTALQQFSTQGINFFVSIVLARLLLPSEFGLIAMIAVFMGIGAVLLNAGLGSSLIRTDNPTQEDYSTVFFFNLIGSVFMYVLMFFVAPLVADFYQEDQLTPIIRWYSIIFIINAFAIIQTTRLTKLLDFKTQMRVSIPSTIFSGLIGVGLAYTGHGVWSLVIMGIAQAFASALQLWLYSNWKPSWVFSKHKFKYHFNYGYKLTLSGLIESLFSNAYAIIIGKFFAPAQVGFFNRADSLMKLPVGNVGTILNKVTFPLFAEIKNDDIRLKGVYKKVMQMSVFLVAPILITMAVLAEPLFRFLFTEKWLPAVPYFQILAVTGIMYPINAYNLNILRVKGRSDIVLKLQVIKKILFLIIIFITFQFGIYALLFGSVIQSFLVFFINTYYSGKFISYYIWEQVKNLAPIILVAAFSGALVFCIDMFFKVKLNSDLLRLLIGSSFEIVCYILITFLFKFNTLFELFNLLKKNK